MNTASDIKSFVQALGGAKKVASIAGVQPGAVYMAVSRGSIPHKWRLPIFAAAKAQRIKFDPTLLGLDAA